MDNYPLSIINYERQLDKPELIIIDVGKGLPGGSPFRFLWIIPRS